MNKFSDENNFNNKEANKWVGIHGVIFDVDGMKVSFCLRA